jgi:probable HAF family extracellular repeat protein
VVRRGYSEASGINARGQIVGYSTTKTGPDARYLHAVMWDKGQITDLGTLSNDTWSMATAINARGQIVGVPSTSTGPDHAVMWDHGRITDLGTLSGDIESGASAINTRGQIVGYSDNMGLGHFTRCSGSARLGTCHTRRVMPTSRPSMEMGNIPRSIHHWTRSAIARYWR